MENLPALLQSALSIIALPVALFLLAGLARQVFGARWLGRLTPDWSGTLLSNLLTGFAAIVLVVVVLGFAVFGASSFRSEQLPLYVLFALFALSVVYLLLKCELRANS